MSLDALLDAIGAAPCLPGARCRGRSALFDPPVKGEDPGTVAARHAQAVGLCSHCPSINRCTDWSDSLKPSKRPPGVTAGRISGSHKQKENHDG
jgi:hypothetical protein